MRKLKLGALRTPIQGQNSLFSNSKSRAVSLPWVYENLKATEGPSPLIKDTLIKCVVVHDYSKHHFSWCGFCCFVIDCRCPWMEQTCHRQRRWSFRHFPKLAWQQDLSDIQIPRALPGYSDSVGQCAWKWTNLANSDFQSPTQFIF